MEWGQKEGEDVTAHVLMGWKMTHVLGVCLLRLGIQSPDNPTEKAALNLAITPEMCDELALALSECAQSARDELGQA